jgi:uncharacterized protein (TIGR02271 family)
MTTTQRSVVIGVFDDHRQADLAVAELHRVGFDNTQVGIASRDPDKAFATDKGTQAAVGAAAGAAAGAGLGGLVALGILAGVIPGIGPAIAGGTLAMILANAAGGAAIVGVAGALVGLGIPTDEAKHYEGEFHAGRTLVTVQNVGNRFDEAWKILHRFGGYNRQVPRSAEATSGARVSRSTEATGEESMRLHEEHLHAQKQPVKTGEVRVRKEVVTENQTLNVPVTREEVVIERHPVGSQTASRADIRPGEEIRIPVKEEKVNVTKETVAKEEVKVGKRQVQETEQVSGTVRKEQVRVEHEGKVNVSEKDKPSVKH